MYWYCEGWAKFQTNIHFAKKCFLQAQVLGFMVFYIPPTSTAM